MHTHSSQYSAQTKLDIYAKQIRQVKNDRVTTTEVKIWYLHLPTYKNFTLWSTTQNIEESMNLPKLEED